MADNRDYDDEIKRLEQQILELKLRLPKHSVKPRMLQELEELEERLENLKVMVNKE